MSREVRRVPLAERDLEQIMREVKRAVLAEAPTETVRVPIHDLALFLDALVRFDAFYHDVQEAVEAAERGIAYVFNGDRWEQYMPVTPIREALDRSHP